MDRQILPPETDRHDIELATLAEAFVASSSRRRAREFLDMLERLIDVQEEMAVRRLHRIGPNPDPAALAKARVEAVPRLRIILDLGRRLLATRAA